MRVTRREMKPGETMFGGEQGILVPFKKPSEKTSDTKPETQSKNSTDQPSVTTSATTGRLRRKESSMKKFSHRIAGPDDPIYKSGPQVFVPASKPSTGNSPSDTTGADPSSPSPKPSAPLNQQGLPPDPAEDALQAQEEAYRMREAGASAHPSPDRSQ
jgi:hypothetical protein